MYAVIIATALDGIEKVFITETEDTAVDLSVWMLANLDYGDTFIVQSVAFGQEISLDRADNLHVLTRN